MNYFKCFHSTFRNFSFSAKLGWMWRILTAIQLPTGASLRQNLTPWSAFGAKLSWALQRTTWRRLRSTQRRRNTNKTAICHFWKTIQSLVRNGNRKWWWKKQAKTNLMTICIFRRRFLMWMLINRPSVTRNVTSATSLCVHAVTHSELAQSSPQSRFTSF